MRNLGRALPRLLLPAAIGLGLAYLATGFLPRPEPSLRPPEELLAHGQGLDLDSPVRAVLERNVLRLKSPPFTPPGSPPASPDAPDAAEAAMDRALSALNATTATTASAAPAAASILSGGAGTARPAFGGPAAGPGIPQGAPAAQTPSAQMPAGRTGAASTGGEPTGAKPPKATPPLSGGPSVVGRVAAP